MIDFGFSKKYISQGRHIPDSKAKRDFIGNYWFRSDHPWSITVPSNAHIVLSVFIVEAKVSSLFSLTCQAEPLNCSTV